MPIVSINLSRPAYQCYQDMTKGSRSRRVSYLIVRNYLDPTLGYHPAEEKCKRCKGKVAPMVELGDVRIMENGDRCKWTINGWELIE